MYKLGVNSHVVKDISGNGLSFDDLKIDVIELGFDDIPLIVDGKVNYAAVQSLNSFDIEFTMHVPPSDARDERIRLDFGIKSRRNIKIMENVFKIASSLDIKSVVIHGGDISESYWKAFLNTKNQIDEISKLAEDYTVNLCLENMEDNRVGFLPHQLLSLLKPNISITLDVGHAFLMSRKYGVPFRKYFDVLGKYITHVHLHDNMGYVDNYMALGEGIIDVNLALSELLKVNPREVILEISNYRNPYNILKSINIVKSKNSTT
ncbi:MAG: sugar phosphate isomerase/epimerase family protein [Candidatus Asgardarchaeia archaeon]